jgi:nitronate monooxygenase
LHRSLEQDVPALQANPDAARADYDAGVQAGDFTRAHATVGEAVGLIADIPTAQTLIDRITQQAQSLLAK